MPNWLKDSQKSLIGRSSQIWKPVVDPLAGCGYGCGYPVYLAESYPRYAQTHRGTRPQRGSAPEADQAVGRRGTLASCHALRLEALAIPVPLRWPGEHDQPGCLAGGQSQASP